MNNLMKFNNTNQYKIKFFQTKLYPSQQSLYLHSLPMQIQQDFNKLLLTLQRSINCLTDQDRNTRKSGLTAICSQLQKVEPLNIARLFVQTNLQQYLVKRTLWDKIQNNRELTLKILTKFCNKVKSDIIKNDNLKPFVEELIKRINNTPFPQTSEDLRLEILKLLQKMVGVYPDAFLWFLPQLSNALAKTLADPYAEIKHASNSIINTLCERFKDNMGQHALPVIKSLSLNLTHQHSKVRKGTLLTSGKLLITHNAGGHFQHIQVSIKASLSDKSGDVRKQAILCVGRLLKGFGPKWMKMYEAQLVGYLLAGLSDQSEEIVKEAIKQLEQCGEAIKEMQGTQDKMDVQQ